VSEHLEPEIAINGTRLDQAQAMTLRVALGDFAIFVADQLKEEPDDRLWQAYAERASEIAHLMHTKR